MELIIDLLKCKIFYVKDGGEHKLLDIQSIEKSLNENGDEMNMIYLKDKREKNE